MTINEARRLARIAQRAHEADPADGLKFLRARQWQAQVDRMITAANRR